jgi:hypothetical protein
MMGRQTGDQSQLFYLFNLERRIPAGHLLRRINPVVSRILGELREKLTPFYSDIGRPSIDPELMIRMLIVGYCYGIRFERKLCEEYSILRRSGSRNANDQTCGRDDAVVGAEHCGSQPPNAAEEVALRLRAKRSHSAWRLSDQFRPKIHHNDN